MVINVHVGFKSPNKQSQKRITPHHTLSIQNKNRILKASREKDQVTYKVKISKMKGNEMMYFKSCKKVLA
jgi:hypothetical protein